MVYIMALEESLSFVQWHINLCGLFNARRVRLIFVFGVYFRVWGRIFVVGFIIFGSILMKRLVSFGKLKISSGLVFLKRSFKMLV